MKGGLAVLPQLEDLERAYAALLHLKPAAPGPEELALFAQWARFDPRLAEIWVGHLSARWKEISPMALREALLRQPWPAAGAVLLEFASEVAGSERGLFRLWSAVVTEGFGRADAEQFFIGQRRVGGREMFDDARFTHAEYRRWGYLGRERLAGQKRRKERPATGFLDPATRLEVLKSLLESSSRIDTETYWNAVGKSISRRQAERDLKSCRWLRAVGRTKGRQYLKTANRNRAR